MKYQITKQSDTLEIKVEGNEDKEQMLEMFERCRDGRCSCPTKEYKKLDSMQVEQVDGKINLRLKSKEGTQFNQAEIERCLEHTRARIKAQK